MVDRNMELYAPTRQDRDGWLRVFNLIINMNKDGISTETMSPFVYELHKKYQVLSDSKLSQTQMHAKNANPVINDGIHEDALISEKVGDWLMENQSMMTLPIQGAIYQS